MERFDPNNAAHSPALARPDWPASQTMTRPAGFGDRAIGELVRAIVGRLGQDAPCSPDQD